MSYGCRIWDAQGNLILDTNDYTARLVYMDIKPGNAQGSTYIYAASGNRPLVLVAPTVNSVNKICLKVNITSWGSLSWEPIWDGYHDWVNGQWVWVPDKIISEETLITVYVCDEKAW